MVNATVFCFGFGYFHVVFIEKSILDISQSQRQSYTLHAHGHVSVGGWVLSWWLYVPETYWRSWKTYWRAWNFCWSTWFRYFIRRYTVIYLNKLIKSAAAATVMVLFKYDVKGVWMACLQIFTDNGSIWNTPNKIMYHFRSVFKHIRGYFYSYVYIQRQRDNGI